MKKKRSGGVHPFKSRLNLAPFLLPLTLTLPHFNILLYYYTLHPSMLFSCFFFYSVDRK